MAGELALFGEDMKPRGEAKKKVADLPAPVREAWRQALIAVQKAEEERQSGLLQVVRSGDLTRLLELPARPAALREPRAEEVLPVLITLEASPTPREWIHYRPVGKAGDKMLYAPYIPADIVRDLLNCLFGASHWWFEIQDERITDTQAYVKGELVFRFVQDGKVVEARRSGRGSAFIRKEMEIANAVKAAESKAIVNAVSRWLFRDVYHTDNVIARGEFEAERQKTRGEQLMEILQALGYTTPDEMRRAIQDYARQKFNVEAKTQHIWRELTPAQKRIVFNHFSKLLREKEAQK